MKKFGMIVALIATAATVHVCRTVAGYEKVETNSATPDGPDPLIADIPAV